MGSIVVGIIGSRPQTSNAIDLKFTSSSWGEFIPVLYGTARVPGKVVWCGQMHQINPGSKGKGGGKAYGKKGNSNTPPYVSVSFALAFCEGPVDSVNRMWADGNLFYDRTNPQAVQNNPFTNFTFHQGTPTQTGEGPMIAWVKQHVPSAPNSAPGYRDMCYIFFNEMNITPFGNRIPNITAELTTSQVPNIPVIAVGSATGALNKGLTVSGPNTTLNGFDAAVDWETQRMFTVQWGPDGGIRVVDLVNNKELSQKLLPNPIAISLALDSNSLYVATSDNVLHKLDSNTLVEKASLNYFGMWIDGLDLTGFGVGLIATATPTAKGTEDIVFICGCTGFPGIGGAYCNFAVVDGTTMEILTTTNPTGPLTGANKTLVLPSGTGFTLSPAPVAVACLGATASLKAELILVNFGGNLPVGLAEIVTIVVQQEVSQGIFGIPTGTYFAVSLETTGSFALTENPNQMVFDTTDSSIIVSDYTAQTLTKYLLDGNQVWSVPGSMGLSNSYNQSLLLDGILGFFSGNNVFAGGNSFKQISTVTGETIQAGLGTTGPSDAGGFQIFDSVSNSLIMSGPGADFRRIYFGISGNGPYNVAAILDDVCRRSNLLPGQYDTSQITSQVTGYVISRLGNGKTAIEQLAKAFFFDIVESDFKLKFVPRGNAPTATLVQDDLAAESAKGNTGDYWVATRQQQQEMPMQVNIKYMDQNDAYQDSAVYAKRSVSPIETVQGKQKQTIELPIVTDLTSAQNIANQWLYTIWTERTTYKTMVGWQYLYLDPTDNVTVNLNNGNSYTVRATSVELGADYSLKMAFVGEDLKTYVPALEPGALGTSTGPVGHVPGPQFARLMFLPLPLITDTDDTGGASTCVYYTAGALTKNWLGGMIFESTDGATFGAWAQIAANATWGTAVTALPTPKSFFATDNVNTVTLLITNQNAAITTLSYLDFLNDGNLALLGNEVIQFQNVSVNGDGTVTLSTLLRGRRGTEWACDQHQTGERFVFLDRSGIQHTSQSLSLIDVTQYFKLISIGGSLDGQPAMPAAFTGYDLKPYAPVNFTIEAVGPDVLVEWVRRSRWGGRMQDGVAEIPIGEEAEAYTAYILTAPYNAAASNWKAPTSYLRTYSGLTAPEFTYTAAQMTADGYFPASSTLYVVVFQLSASIGVGWPGAASIPHL